MFLHGAQQFRACEIGVYPAYISRDLPLGGSWQNIIRN